MPTQFDLRFTFPVGKADFEVLESSLKNGLSEPYRLDVARSSFDAAIDFSLGGPGTLTTKAVDHQFLGPATRAPEDPHFSGCQKNYCKKLRRRRRPGVTDANMLRIELLATQEATRQRDDAPGVRSVCIFLVLDDVVGHAMQLNYLRNRKRAERYVLEGVVQETAAGDAENTLKMEKLRKRVIALQIEGMRKSAEQNPGPWYLPHFGPERYLKHIDQAAWQEALKEDARHGELVHQELDTSADFCTIIQSTLWKQQQRTDFSNHTASALGHEHMVACCVAGSGVTEQEQQQLWDPVLNLPADDPDNWLARALGSLDTSYTAHLAQTPTEQDDAYIASKEAINLTGTFLAKGEKKIREIRASIRTQRAANANTATLIESSAGHLFRLRDKNPKAYRKLIRQVTLALITRNDIVPEPTLIRGTWQQTTQAWMAVLHGDPRLAAHPPVQVTQGDTTGQSKVNKPALSGAVQGAIVLAPPNSRQETIATVAWVVKKIEQGGHLDYDQLR